MAARPRATEAQCQAAIIEAAQLGGWRVHAERPARQGDGWATPIQGDRGFPDLVLVRSGVMLAVELKRRPHKLTDGQPEWLAALDQVPGVEAFVLYVPDDMAALNQYLVGYGPLPRR